MSLVVQGLVTGVLGDVEPIEQNRGAHTLGNGRRIEGAPRRIESELERH